MKKLILATMLICAHPHLALSSPRDVEPLLKPCNGTELCNLKQTQFREEYRDAFKRQYGSQRNVAYMLEDRDAHTEHGVVRNWMAACAWRAVIMNSRHKEVDDSDRANLEFACRRLDRAGKAAAAIWAGQLMDAIYRRPLAAGFVIP